MGKLSIKGPTIRKIGDSVIITPAHAPGNYNMKLEIKNSHAILFENKLLILSIGYNKVQMVL